jgi:hypothetical protein
MQVVRCANGKDILARTAKPIRMTYFRCIFVCVSECVRIGKICSANYKGPHQNKLDTALQDKK